jgi:hypothetical protein
MEIESLENEIWVDVIGYDGYYEISNFGRVKSLKRLFYNAKGAECYKPERILKYKHKKNRYWIQFSINKINTQLQLARLMALHFVNKYDNEPLWFNDNDCKNVKPENLIILNQLNVVGIFNNNSLPLNNETSLLLHTIGVKRCSVCKEIKEHDNFCEIKKNRNVNNVCKHCANKLNNVYISKK